MILREANRGQLYWDQRLSEGLTQRWNAWGKRAKKLEDIKVPRCYGTTQDDVDLHVFCDASENAIAAVAYVVQISTGSVMMCFSKCRVAPLKSKSVQRLELDAAVLGVRVMEIVKKANPWPNIARTVMWVDAREVLYWIRSTERRYKIYVANRVYTILSSTRVDDWRWVPTEINPADMATKDQPKGKSDALWWNGPQFLKMDESMWPNSFLKPENELEIRHSGIIRTAAISSYIPDVTRFSRWLVFLRAAARVRKASNMFKNRCKATEELSADDEKWAEREIIKMIQWDLKPEVMRQFSPFKDEFGIWSKRKNCKRGPEP